VILRSLGPMAQSPNVGKTESWFLVLRDLRNSGA